MAGALNQLLTISKEEYIHICDDDDFIKEKFYEKTVGFLDNPKHYFCSGVYVSNEDLFEEFRDGKWVTSHREQRMGKRPDGFVPLDKLLSLDYPLLPSLMLFRRSSLYIHGLANSRKYDLDEDSDLFTKILLNGEIATLSDSLAVYCWHKKDGVYENQSKRNEGKTARQIRYDNVNLREAINGGMEVYKYMALFKKLSDQKRILTREVQELKVHISRLEKSNQELQIGIKTILKHLLK